MKIIICDECKRKLEPQEKVLVVVCNRTHICSKCTDDMQDTALTRVSTVKEEL